MIRPILFVLILLAAAPVTQAHFVFVVPEADGSRAKIILSEDLEADEEIDIAILSGAILAVRDAAGHATPLTLPALNKGEHAYDVDVPGTGTRVISGVAELGVQQRGSSKPYLLIYYPKTIIGNAFDSNATLGNAAPVEFVPLGKPGQLKFQLLANGRPVVGAEVHVILPDGSDKQVVTDEKGQTPVFKQLGRYGLWARHAEPIPGEKDGKKYDEVRRYPTLVIDVGKPATQ